MEPDVSGTDVFASSTRYNNISMLVHVKEHGANGWRDSVQCCGSHSGYVLRDMMHLLPSPTTSSY